MSYPRAKSGVNQRSSRPRKRKFHFKSDYDPHEKKRSSEGTSSSSKKIDADGMNKIKYDRTHDYKIIEFYTFFNILSSLIICRQCKCDVKFTSNESRGLGFKGFLSCRCPKKSFIHSAPLLAMI